MLKYIVTMLLGMCIGVYIGVTYKDLIVDATNASPLEQIQNMYEGAKEQASDTADELAEKLEELQS
ncbi:YtxH domain-containing protein [Photobacterium sp.]|uniref:YtxH domain-containing protein n=1 Tax=Photobacterium sp. TaxID=660 RepID=UPI00299F3C4A|nr:YtxH domain-containing protein [Photobacterium sp.]MDX1304363.1 YtxH domain-containing protein [Photobacterium sp.]